MKQLFTEIAPLNLQAQQEVVTLTFEKWKDELEQTDDVLMIEVRI